PQLASNCGSDETWIQWATTCSLLPYCGSGRWSGRLAEGWVQAAPEAPVIFGLSIPCLADPSYGHFAAPMLRNLYAQWDGHQCELTAHGPRTLHERMDSTQAHGLG
ncbi:hypothetical protein JMJ77_0005260, partial [Colletotrichum scovillei]